MPNIRLTIPVTPPGTMGTTVGAAIYLESPDVSSTSPALMDGVTDMSGTFALQPAWAPQLLARLPYVAADQPWVVDFAAPGHLNPRVSNVLRVYVNPYSVEYEPALVQAGLGGATPSVTVTLAASVSGKPASATNVTTDLVTGISGSVSAPVMVSGKLLRPISVTVDLSGLSTEVSQRWAYQLLGFKDNDLTQDAVLASGIITDVTGGLIPAGPDGIATAHTFGPADPTVSTSITIYAVAGEIASDRFTPGVVRKVPGAFYPNNIVPGITASCVVTIGTTTGVTDPTVFVQTLLTSVFGNVGGQFDITPLAIDNARVALLAIDTPQLHALAVAAAQLATGAVTSSKIFAAAVDTVALANLAVTTAILAASAVTTAKVAAANITTALIANAAITTALIANAQITTALIGTAQITTALIANAQITSALVATAAIGTAAIQNVAITTALIASVAVGTAQIANLAVGTAQIANLAVTNAKINDLDVSKLNAGTISVAISLTAPTIVVTGSGYTINLDATNGFKMVKSGAATVQIGASASAIRVFDGVFVTDLQQGLVSVSATSGTLQAELDVTAGLPRVLLFPSGGGNGLIMSHLGITNINGTTGYTGTLAAAIAAGKSIVGGVIVS